MEIESQGWFDVNPDEHTMICCVACLKSKRKRHKFNAVKAECDGIKFSSKAEKAFYLRLKYEKQEGKVLFFLMQVPFSLPGKVKYIVDFQVFYSNGEVAFIDVKGVETPMFRLKKKQVEELYPITIETVK